MRTNDDRELLVLRHAKSDWDCAADCDFDRPLTKRGKQEAPKIGDWLRQEGLVPDQVVSSPARRARQTALRVCKAVQIPKGGIAWDPQVYEASLAGLLAVLARSDPDANRVLLIGHNPGLEFLVRHLAGDALLGPDDGKLLPTAALARLAMPEHWAPLTAGCARLVSITRARGL